MRIEHYFVTTVALAVTGATWAGDGGLQILEDKDAWIEAVGDFVTLDFTGFKLFTIITDQYEEQGVVFPDGDDWVTFYSPNGFPNDGWGIDGGVPDQITIELSEPQRWFAVEFPGRIRARMYLNDTLVQDTNWLGFRGPDVGEFRGIISDVPFTTVVFDDPVQNQVVMDDLHVGTLQASDVNADGIVDIADLIAVILNWGTCPEVYCTGDTNVDGVIDASDLFAVLTAWD